MPNKDKIELIITYLSGNASIAEEKELFDWIKSNPDNEQTYKQFNKIWHISGNLKKDFNANEKWEEFKLRVQQDSTVGKIQPKNHWFKIAAAIAFLIGFGVLIKVLVFDSTSKVSQINESVVMLDIITTDSSKTFVLPDHTKIYLNKNSKFSYSKIFNENTRVTYLEGEAFFDVCRDTLRPFIVNSFGTVTKVLGTSFNIIGNKEEVSVIVVSGKVEFQSSEHPENDNLILEVGDKGTFNEKSISMSKEKNKDKNFIWWKKVKLEHEAKKILNKLKRKIK